MNRLIKVLLFALGALEFLLRLLVFALLFVVFSIGTVLYFVGWVVWRPITEGNVERSNLAEFLRPFCFRLARTLR